MNQPIVDGVLFDIDDTLVNLESAMSKTLRHIASDLLAHFDEAQWTEYILLYTQDPQGYYDHYLAREISFAEQRIRRMRYAHACLGQVPLGDEVVERWHAEYAETLPRHFAPFEDVHPLLDALEEAGIPYGAISNNTVDLQRTKLDLSGLERVTVLVGVDTIGRVKPEPEIFHEGARRIGADPARTLYVGDNRLVDAEGSTAAGLRGLWLNRSGACAAGYTGEIVAGLDEVGVRYLRL